MLLNAAATQRKREQVETKKKLNNLNVDNTKPKV